VPEHSLPAAAGNVGVNNEEVFMSIRSHSGASLFLLLGLFGLSALPAESQSFTFVTKQEVLRLGLPTVIKIVNKDNERHDFGSTMFEGLQARIERDGVIVYGRGLGGVMLDPKRDATIRFNMERPGRHTFRCSIHPNMKGELLLLSTEAV
jgi:plastocyanin